MVSIPRTHTEFSSRPRRQAVCWLFVAFLAPTSATAVDARLSPHRHVPAKNLIAYFEFDGQDAHVAAWKGTSAHAALTKTKAGAMISELARQGAEWLFKKDGPSLTGADAIALHEHLIRHGFSIGVHSLGQDAYSITLVLNNFDSKELGPSLKRLKQQVESVDLPTPTRFRGRDFILDANGNRLRSEMHTNLITAILDTTDGKLPNVETHVSYRASVNDRKDLRGFEPGGFFFMSPTDDKGLIMVLLGIAEGLDAQAAQPAPSGPERTDTSPGQSPLVDEAISRASAEAETLPLVFTDKDLDFMKPGGSSAKPSSDTEPPTKPNTDAEEDFDFTPAQIEALGLNGVNRIVGRFGFQHEAFLTDLRIEAPSPRKGINAWFDQPSFGKDKLPPIPQGVATFAVGSLDLEKTYGYLVDIGQSLDYSVGEDLRQFEKIVPSEANVRFYEDLLKYLGPTWCVYLAPPGPGDRKPRRKSDPTAGVLLVDVKDATAFSKVLDKMASYVNENDGFLGPAQTPILEKLQAPAMGYRLTSRAAATLELDDGVQPTIMVGKSYISLASTPELARQALGSETKVDGRWKPSGKFIDAFAGLPDDLTFLDVSDQRGSRVPETIAALPSMTQMLIDMSEEDDPDNASPWSILDLIGVPRPGRFQVKIDRSQIAKAEDLRPFLLPSIVATSVDERGCRIISRGAFPFAMLASATELKYWFGAGWTTEDGFRFKEKINFTNFGLDPTEW